MAYVEGEFPINGNGNGTNVIYPYPMGYGYGGGFGDSMNGIWGLLAIALIFGGGNFGWGGNNGNAYAAANGVESSIHNAIDTLQISTKLDNITSDLNTDFGNVINAITSNGYENRLAINDLGFNMQNCCCQTRETINQNAYTLGSQIQDLKYTLATEECATRQAAADNTQRIIDYMNNKEMEAIRAENVALKGELSQQAQNNYLISQLKPTPVPSFPAQNLYGWYGNGSFNNANIQ